MYQYRIHLTIATSICDNQLMKKLFWLSFDLWWLPSFLWSLLWRNASLCNHEAEQQQLLETKQERGRKNRTGRTELGSHYLLHGYTSNPKEVIAQETTLYGSYHTLIAPGWGLSLSHIGSEDIPDPNVLPSFSETKRVWRKTHLIERKWGLLW